MKSSPTDLQWDCQRSVCCLQPNPPSPQTSHPQHISVYGQYGNDSNPAIEGFKIKKKASEVCLIPFPLQVEFFLISWIIHYSDVVTFSLQLVRRRNNFSIALPALKVLQPLIRAKLSKDHLMCFKIRANQPNGQIKLGALNTGDQGLSMSSLATLSPLVLKKIIDFWKKIN